MQESQLKEVMRKEVPDIVGLQGTIKESFSERELMAIIPGHDYRWNWIPAHGHSGGILVGVKK